MTWHCIVHYSDFLKSFCHWCNNTGTLMVIFRDSKIWQHWNWFSVSMMSLPQVTLVQCCSPNKTLQFAKCSLHQMAWRCKDSTTISPPFHPLFLNTQSSKHLLNLTLHKFFPSWPKLIQYITEDRTNLYTPYLSHYLHIWFPQRDRLTIL